MSKNREMKGVTFNLEDPIEKFMWEKAEELKKKKVSFSGLMKNFFFAYLLNRGEIPPEMDLSRIMGKMDFPKGETESESKPELPVEELDTEGIMNAPFSLDEDDEDD